jgi:ankyrin repeat protein
LRGLVVDTYPPPQVRFISKTGGNDLNAVDAFGNTALHVAVERGHVEVVAALLDEGANIGLANAQVTVLLAVCVGPLHAGCCRGALRCIMPCTWVGSTWSQSFCGGASPPVPCDNISSRFCSGALCDVSDGNDVSPVHVACDRGHADIVQLLCDSGAEVNKRTRDSLCPLHLACRCGLTSLSLILSLCTHV